MNGIIIIDNLSPEATWEYSVDGGTNWESATDANKLYGTGYFLPQGVIPLSSAVTTASAAFQTGGTGFSRQVVDEAGHAFISVRNPTDDIVNYAWEHNSSKSSGTFPAIPGHSFVPVPIPDGGSTWFYDQDRNTLGQGTRSPNSVPQTAEPTRDITGWGINLPQGDYAANDIQIRIGNDTYAMDRPVTIDRTPPAKLAIDDISPIAISGQTDADIVSLSVTSQTGDTIYSSDPVETMDDETWEIPTQNLALTKGDYTAVLQTTDAAGNVGEDQTLNLKYGGTGDEFLYGGGDPVVIFGGDGDDVVLGSPNDDWLFGMAGNDALNGGRGQDTLMGGAGDDRFLVEAPQDGARIDGGTGIDTLTLVFGEQPLDFLFAPPDENGAVPATNIEHLVLDGRLDLVLQLEDVIQLTDARNELTVFKDDPEATVTLPTEMIERDSPALIDGYSVTTYTYTPDADASIAAAMDRLTIDLHVATPPPLV